MTIEEIRNHTFLSQEEFAKKYNIPLSTLKSWENGTKSPTKNMLTYIMFQTAKDYPHIKHFIFSERGW